MKYEMNGIRAHVGKWQKLTKFVGNPTRRDHLCDAGEDRRTISKCVL